MNKLLARQIEKCLGKEPDLSVGMRRLLDVVSEAYDGFDADRRLIERSLDISSQELREMNQRLRQEVAERKAAEERQGLLLEQVLKANDELTRFAYAVSHDLKGPLRGILTLASWIIEEDTPAPGAEMAEHMDLLVRRACHMNSLLDGLLEYSEIRPRQERPSRVDLHQVISAIVKDMALPDRITVTLEDPLPVLQCERQLLTRIFLHLLDNAVHFMDKPEGHIVVNCTEGPDFWTLRVIDNGPGIEARHFDRIFRIFQTLSHWQDSGHTGIGLPVVKKSVEVLGGRIWVESEVGQGSTFLFTLPKHLKAADSEHLGSREPIEEAVPLGAR